MADIVKANLKDNLMCCICRDIFQDPRTTKCGHSFCYRCLYSHISSRLDTENVVFCPICKTTICSSLKRSEDAKRLTDMFPSNDLLRRFVKVFRNGSDWSESLRPQEKEKCPSHNMSLEKYCITHESVICKKCEQLSHTEGTCNCIHVNETANLCKTKTKQLKSRFRKLSEEISKLARIRENSERLLQDSYEVVLEKIDLLETQIKEFLDETLDKLGDLRTVTKDMHDNLSSKASYQQVLTSMIENAKSLLAEASQSNDPHWILPSLSELTSQANDIDQELQFIPKRCCRLMFDEDKKLNHFLNADYNVGTVSVHTVLPRSRQSSSSYRSNASNDSTSGSAISLQNCDSFNVSETGNEACLITGLACTDDVILITDNENGKVKMYDYQGNCLDSITLTDPQDIAVLSGTMDVVVTQPDLRTLSFIEIIHNRSLRKLCEVNKKQYVKKYTTVCSMNSNKFAVGCCDGENPSIDILTYYGKIIERISSVVQGNILFRNPQYIGFDSLAKQIVISDSTSNQVVRLCLGNVEASTVHQITSGRSSGICCDKNGNVYVGLIDRDAVRCISPGGGESLAVKRKHGVKHPLALCSSDNHLIVSEEYPSARILCFLFEESS